MISWLLWVLIVSSNGSVTLFTREFSSKALCEDHLHFFHYIAQTESFNRMVSLWATCLPVQENPVQENPAK